MTVLISLNGRVRSQTQMNMIALDVYYKSICQFYCLKLYLQHHIEQLYLSNAHAMPSGRLRRRIQVIMDEFLTMKVDESADRVVLCVARLRNRRFHRPLWSKMPKYQKYHPK
jgi:hypothetical protein